VRHIAAGEIVTGVSRKRCNRAAMLPGHARSSAAVRKELDLN